MSTAADPAEEPTKKGSKLPLLIGLALAVIGAGSGFFAVQTGLLGGATEATEKAVEETKEVAEALPSVAFVAIDPLVISLPGNGVRHHLRFSAQLEVAPDHVADIEAIKPRIVDVLNGYLRAVDLDELEDPTALMRLRGQMLRRVRVVTGEKRVNDLLIMEFVLS
ncbi:flagellar basal body-associated FliL family protein [Cognatiyoonia sp. IB215446]|uniref:flagellar basal body-associated FliL family protein n=1 Tax=Cognatiyoonia sp. IB215446 TaxID=3097355 RepID=UPI002A136D36|nr:flagellar basal body-associated FliL family protein [Cognatiyoonia sp. IB215446]MDX8346406.1 flagellar basal body-associated FliL family protein [Cognatiyoonia sp. IB215446]